MRQYKMLVRRLVEQPLREDRTRVGTYSLFGERLEFDLRAGFPLVTGKFTSLKVVAEELRWFLSGSTNIKDLDSKIWDEWAALDGDLGPIYGHQWRHCPKDGGGEVDQIADLVYGLKNNPNSRRHILSAWNVGMLHEMALPPCHAFVQFYVDRGRLSCMLTQRSADVFIGLPYNIASYALLTHLLAKECGLKVGRLVVSIGDAHIYANHLPQVAEYLVRGLSSLPSLQLEGGIDSWSATVTGYQYEPRIPAKVAV